MIGLTVFLTVSIATVLAGLDYVAEVNQLQDAVTSRNKAYRYLLSQRNKQWGWGTRDFPETHRILTALSLSGEMQNETENLEYELSVKQLELELAIALMRGGRQISAGQIALYANALLATCRDPNDFYRTNIVRIMKHKKPLSLYAKALISLADCNSGIILSKAELFYYFNVLEKYSNQSLMFPDNKAMIILALSCAMKSTRHYSFIESYLRQPLKSFKKSQTSEGGFGNIYSSALVVQALIAAEDKGEGWSFQKSVDYILSQQKEDGSFGDLLATYFALPVLAGKSLVNLRTITCHPSNASLEDDDSQDTKWNKSILVRYSLWGKSNISEVFVVSENSTFLDVMEVAQTIDDRYRFTGVSYSWGYLVETIGDVSNDKECNKYWTLYKVDKGTEEVEQTKRGVTVEIPENGDHYIFWYTKSPFFTNEDPACEDSSEYGNFTKIEQSDANTDIALD